MSATHPTLYHKGTTGAVYQWSIRTEGATKITEHGQVGGQLMISRNYSEAKNVGRSNVTTPEQQAEIEALAEWTHKKDRKYVTSIEEVHAKRLRVMLAPNDKWDVTKKYAKYPAFVQRKLDGGRCLAYWEGDDIKLMTRGQKFWNVPHIVEQLKKSMPRDAMFDGELYIHGVSLQTIMSWLKKNRPESLQIGFHIYDVPMADGEEKPQFERVQDLTRLVPMQCTYTESTECFGEHYDLYNEKLDCVFTPADETPNIFRVETYSVLNEDEVDKLEEIFVEGGYEGLMFRNANGLYDWGGRSKNLLKRKRFDAAEFKVVGYTQATGDHDGCVKWVCETSDGKDTFEVVPNGSLTDRREWYIRYQIPNPRCDYKLSDYTCSLEKDNIHVNFLSWCEQKNKRSNCCQYY